MIPRATRPGSTRRPCRSFNAILHVNVLGRSSYAIGRSSYAIGNRSRDSDTTHIDTGPNRFMSMEWVRFVRSAITAIHAINGIAYFIVDLVTNCY